MSIKFHNIKKLHRYYLSKLYDRWYCLAFSLSWIISLIPLLAVNYFLAPSPNSSFADKVTKYLIIIQQNYPFFTFDKFNSFSFYWTLTLLFSYLSSAYSLGLLNYASIWKLLGANASKGGKKKVNESGEDSLVISFFPRVTRSEMSLSRLLAFFTFSYLNNFILFNSLLLLPALLLKWHGLTAWPIIFKIFFLNISLFPLAYFSSFLVYFYFDRLLLSATLWLSPSIITTLLFKAISLKSRSFIQLSSSLVSGPLFAYLYWQKFEEADIN